MELDEDYVWTPEWERLTHEQFWLLPTDAASRFKEEDLIKYENVWYRVVYTERLTGLALFGRSVEIWRRPWN